MARGGRAGGHGGRSHGASFGGGHHFGSSFGRNHSSFGHSSISHHSHHFSSSRSRSGGVGGIYPEASIDMMANNMMSPTLINGIYTFAGNQMSFRTQSTTNSPQNPMQILMQTNVLMQNIMMPGMMPQNMQMQTNQSLGEASTIAPNMMGQDMITMMPQNPTGPQPMQQADIIIVGSKTKPGDIACLISTLMSGVFCIFPLCFMCCMWWKKIVAALYELTPEAYRDIGVFLERNQTVTNLNLTVADNAFNAEKARILYESLSRSRVTGFTFVNIGLPCNNRANEADDFLTNIVPIKSLSMSTSLKWGDMIA